VGDREQAGRRRQEERLGPRPPRARPRRRAHSHAVAAHARAQALEPELSAASAGHPDPARWLDAAQRGEATLAALRAAAEDCRACPLWRRATQTVFGEGQARARMLVVGEQPGDQEDREGRPFVGPAGRLLDAALVEAGIPRERVWLTNTVKHFKWKRSGKRRLHERPAPDEVRACRPWLEAEIAALAPEVVLCLGATAAQALLGRNFRVSVQRGARVASPLARHVLATVHPSSLLRAPDAETRRRERARFVADLRVAAKLLRGRDGPRRG
jgi:DNA polymerase